MALSRFVPLWAVQPGTVGFPGSTEGRTAGPPAPPRLAGRAARPPVPPHSSFTANRNTLRTGAHVRAAHGALVQPGEQG